MDTLRQDIQFALRSFRQKPGFTFAALLTLGLGIGATTAIFSVVHGVLLRPLPYAEPQELVVFGQANPSTPPDRNTPISHLNFLDWRDRSRSFESMALWSRANLTVTGLGEALSVSGAVVAGDFFRVFRAQPFIGRGFTDDEMRADGPDALIISHAFWQQHFNSDPDILEQTLEVGGTAVPIVGVTPAGFAYPRGAELYAPAQPEDDDGCGRGCVYMQGVARLAPGSTVETAREDLVAVAAQLEQEYPADNTDVTARVRSLEESLLGSVRQALWILLAAVFMVLLIACANVANLLLVRGATRAAELGLRSVLGASYARVVRQLMTENVLLALSGGIIGVVLASWGVDLLRLTAPPNLPRVDEIALNGTALLFALGLVLMTSLVFGLVPAIRLAKVSVADTLRGSGRGDLGVRQGRGRFAIMVAEVALSVVLLLGAGLLLRSMARVNSVDLGWETEGVAQFTLGLPDLAYASEAERILFFDQLRQRLEALPGAERAGVMLPMMLGSSTYGTTFDRTDRPSEAGREPGAVFRAVDGNAFEVLGVQMVSGRKFQPQDRAGAEPVVIINQALAEEFFPGEDPLDRMIDVGLEFHSGVDGPRRIIGVMEDLRSVERTDPAGPELWVPYAQSAPTSATVVIRGADPAQLLTLARAEVRALDPNLPLMRPATAEQLVAEQSAGARFYLALLAVFAGLAVVLAGIGIYGVVAFVVARRGREIGVRIALGARIREVIGLVVWQGMRPALIGLAVGVVGALAAGRVMAGLLFDVQPHDPLTFAGVTLLLLGVVVLACIVPAGRASRIPPASALRGD